ncbi:MAG: helix-turn-helix transcriptional regulator [Acidimicrobiales bacterium]
MDPELPNGVDESPNPDGFDAQVSGIAALAEPVRRSLYRFVVSQPDAVSRDEAAAGVGVARHVAKFHLDKLADDGLLECEFRRPPGRGGPGAGRPAKFYRRSSRQLAVSLPARQYEQAGRLLATAVTDAERRGVPVEDALAGAARRVGEGLGREARRRCGATDRCPAMQAAMIEVLDEFGYEPRLDGDGVALVNCPFDGLAKEFTDLVCGMNLYLMEGLVDGLGWEALRARLDPGVDRCCVRLAEA